MSLNIARTFKNTDPQTGKKVNRLIGLLLIGTILVNIKSIFADFDIDVGYALALSYRMILGDHMFTDMWEPHQTSAFLATFLMRIFHLVTGSWTGVLIFLNISGVLIQGFIGFAVYKALSKRIDSAMAALMSIFFLAFRPKGIVFPEFSNMQIGFSVLLFLCLLLFLESQDQKKWLVAASVCLSLEILSYPSCLIIYFCVVIILYLYTEKRYKNIALFTISCLGQGICYILFFLRRMGLHELISSLANMIGSDTSHNQKIIDTKSYFEYFNWGMLRLITCLAIAGLVECIVLLYVKKKRYPYSTQKERNRGLTIFSFLVFVSEAGGG